MILTGDCLKTLKTLRAGSYDACLTDPPYGIFFMSKKWDHGVPGTEVWAEVLRVLKPGAPLLAFGGTRTFHRLACAIEDGGFILSDTLCWLHGQGFPKGHAQLKPAWEPITLAWKKGPRVLAIDAARIGGEPVRKNSAGGLGYLSGNAITSGTGTHMTPLGRWPANVLLDETSSALLDQQAPNAGGAMGIRDKRGERHGFKEDRVSVRSDVYVATDPRGGASRFFYCAKAGRSERGEGNTHPTVKPVKLTEYLARLILPANPKAKLLVPFSGSGSEMLGAKRAGWKHITGIEREPEYVKIAERRMDAARNVDGAEPRTKGRNAFTAQKRVA